MWLWLHCVLYARVITGDIDIACYGTPHIRGERNEILFRLVTPYAIHEVPLQYSLNNKPIYWLGDHPQPDSD